MKSVLTLLLVLVAASVMAQPIRYHYRFGQHFRYHFHASKNVLESTATGIKHIGESADADFEISVERVLDSGRAVLRVRTGNLSRTLTDESRAAMVFVPDASVIVEPNGEIDSVYILQDVPRSDKSEYRVRRRLSAGTSVGSVLEYVLPVLPNVDVGTTGALHEAIDTLRGLKGISKITHTECSDLLPATSARGCMALHWKSIGRYLTPPPTSWEEEYKVEFVADGRFPKHVQVAVAGSMDGKSANNQYETTLY